MLTMRSRTIKNERKSMKLPTKRECFDLLKEYRLPQNVIAHSKAVNALSVFLAERLRNSGVKIDVDLVDRASLLHDLDKIITLGKKSHGFETEKILKGMGYPELGRTAKKHKFSFVKGLDSWEEKVINYADKRCLEDKIVSLKERFAYLKKKYGIADRGSERLYYQIEKEIFSIIGIHFTSAERLAEELKALGSF